MNAKLLRSPRIYISIAILFTTLFSLTAFSQPANNAEKEFNKLNKSFHSGNLLPQQYFTKADSLTHQLFSEGKHFETKELVKLLSLYEDIAWSKPDYGRSRVSYYFLFFNNARMFKKKGASMYYAEKITAEFKKNGEPHPLVEQLQKCKIYQEQRLYDKVIEVFKSEKKYLEALPALLSQKKVDEAVGLNAMYILSPTLMGYIKMNNKAAARQTALLAMQIGSAIQKKYPIKRPQMLYNDLLIIDIQHSMANFEQRYNDAKALLNQMQELKITYKDQAINFIDINLARLRIENYLNLKNKDSLQSYISKYESSSNFGKSQSADLAEFKAKLHALNGNYKEGYTKLEDALAYERALQANLMTESSDLLYAYTQAEHTGIALQKTEETKQKRTTWLVFISISASILILTIYLIMVYKSRKARLQIETLNSEANMQIIAMEEGKHQAVKEEQQRLGQDLHDSLSSSIAAFGNQLETLSIDVKDEDLKRKLNALRIEMAETYDVVRSKSHEWFGASDIKQEISFEKQIKLLTEKTLPDGSYNKTIHIDDKSLSGVGTKVRIALLRIIQEAITNIIKHAKAKNIEILLYKEDDNLILTVSDDGVGLTEKKSQNGKTSLGLESIRRRTKYLNGDCKINSSSKGTEIVVEIPTVPM